MIILPGAVVYENLVETAAQAPGRPAQPERRARASASAPRQARLRAWPGKPIWSSPAAGYMMVDQAAQLREALNPSTRTTLFVSPSLLLAP
ncbi:hypothetical protein HB662_15770 [Roseomonas frigidaquae]|uniref:Uncharacterized protein n=1 Tax=Falsiroseomonas frigidaquae TaxID=487318 RepID=A0ABX1F1P4_9PROT|nr:hypothetical protein [Falsiroseomonas frigidaquae]NKE46244.1 hypothetical protein [Falsiroseomonas frigidaquae]